MAQGSTLFHTFKRGVWAPVFLILSGFYCFFVWPGVGPGDSGELATVAATGGVAHAPGYPLLSLIGRSVLFCLPSWDPALVLNVVNLLVAALAAGLIGEAVFQQTGLRVAGYFAAMILGFSRVFWEYALVFEVFALNNLFGAGVLLWLVVFLRDCRQGIFRPSLVLVLALLASTALTHHLTLALILGPAGLTGLVSVLRHGLSRFGEVPWLKLCGVAFAVFLLGLLPVLYLPWAARSGAALNWGNPSTPAALFHLLARSDFGSSSLMNSDLAASLVVTHGRDVSPANFAQAKQFISESPQVLGPGGVVLFLLGVFSLVRTRNFWLVFLVAFLGASTVFFARVNTPMLPLHIGVTERFWILPHLVMAFCGGLGGAFLINLIPPGRLAGHLRITHVVATLMVLVLFVPTVQHGPKIRAMRSQFTRDFGRNLLHGLPENTLMIGQGDMYHNALSYVRDVSGIRQDVEWLDLQKITYEWGVETYRRRGGVSFPEQFTSFDPRLKGQRLADLVEANFGRRPLVLTRLDNLHLSDRFVVLSSGLWQVPYPVSQVIPLEDHIRRFETILTGWNLDFIKNRFSERSWEHAELSSYAAAFTDLGNLLEFRADARETPNGTAITGGAEPWYRKAESLAGPVVSIETRRALGLLNLMAKRPLVEQHVGNSIGLLKKVRSLAEQAVAANADDVNALKVLMSLGKVPELTPPPTLARQIEIQGRIVDLAPAEATEMDVYVHLVRAALSDPALRSVELMEMLAQRQNRQLDRLNAGLEVSENADLRRQRDGVLTSRDATYRVLEQIRVERQIQNSRR